MGSRTAALRSFLCCAYWFSLGACKYSFIWSCLQWWKRPICELNCPVCIIEVSLLLCSELLCIPCIAGIPNRFVHKRERFTVHKWISYSTVVSARWHNMGGNNWFFCLWMASWRAHAPKGLPKGWLILSWEFVILKGKSIFRRISTCKHEGYLLLSNYISFLKTLHHVPWFWVSAETP